MAQHRLKRRYGSSRARVVAYNLDEVYAAIDGKRVTYEGIPVVIHAEMSHGPASRKPYSRVELRPTNAARRNNARYLAHKHAVHDDWDFDVTHEDKFWTEVVPKLVDYRGRG